MAHNYPLLHINLLLFKTAFTNVLIALGSGRQRGSRADATELMEAEIKTGDQSEVTQAKIRSTGKIHKTVRLKTLENKH